MKQTPQQKTRRRMERAMFGTPATPTQNASTPPTLYEVATAIHHYMTGIMEYEHGVMNRRFAGKTPRSILENALAREQKRVNSHEQLVSALNEAHAALQDIIDECPMPKLPYGVKIVEIARNALAANQARQHLALAGEIQGIEPAQ